ncbi:hypothetical protein JJB07_14440 [Tumebacillus sp. ITR2]|uniref:Uncharacterized protein n=1 Tax=Tumebacillus amylolyticus TaxID=2801339 RepID=A0ABS1JC39_9BACL|nr:hypothetical protein [Tumebacillus amylolyticus]MBL0387836.1 hypothetical protein [Tumebacillus amylolyticus]
MKVFAIEKWDGNEWFLVCGVVLVYLALWLIPKRLPSSTTLLLCTWAFTVSKFYDFTFGGGLFDYYDVNDSPRYCIMDLASYFFYAPFGYFFIYLYELWKIRGRWTVLYIVGWSFVGVGIEWIMDCFHVIVYKNGYLLPFSFCIYLASQSLTLLFYHWISSSKK